jgi:pyrroline-5-carboxylate reductase
MMNKYRIAILGSGNIGTAIAHGLIASGGFLAKDITLTRRNVQRLEGLKKEGFVVTNNNLEAVKNSDVIIVAVEPLQIDGVLKEITPQLVPGKHIVISVVTGASVAQIAKQIDNKVTVVRAMLNTAIAVRESMTFLASNGADKTALEIATSIFETVGNVLVINEEQMIAATVLGACGVAFFLRAIRAASQGGVEIGFHSQDALTIAAQTAKGAALLLLGGGNHPEFEIDKVTTPRGCTIAGLNQMEHEGFSSAMIKGITVSADKAAKLYSKPKE